VPGYDDAPRFCSDGAVLRAPGATVEGLHDAWISRTPVVIEFAIEAGALQEPERCLDAPWTLDESFVFARERLAFLVWANTYDLRSGTPVWWWANKAARLGAVATPDGPADIVLPGGTPAWVDGGPRGPLDGIAGVVLHRGSDQH